MNVYTVYILPILYMYVRDSQFLTTSSRPASRRRITRAQCIARRAGCRPSSPTPTCATAAPGVLVGGVAHVLRRRLLLLLLLLLLPRASTHSVGNTLGRLIR